MKTKFLIFLLILMFADLAGFAQKSKSFNKDLKRKMAAEEKQLFTAGEELFETKDYANALSYFLKLNKLFPDVGLYKYRVGICYLYKNDENYKALDYLLDAKKMNPQDPDIILHLIPAYTYNEKIDEAEKAYNKFLEADAADVDAGIEEANNYQNQYLFAKELIASPDKNITIEHVSSDVNTAAAEFAPIISSDGTVMIFTYSGEKSFGSSMNVLGQPDPEGHYNEDVFISQKEPNGSWSAPKSIGNNINTKNKEVANYLTSNRQQLYLSITTLTDKSDIFVSNFENDNWSVPKKIQGKINTAYMEGSACLSADRKSLFFVSNKPLGKGKKDIYKSNLMEDGTWGEPENLGGKINSIHDEDAPFLNSDGTMLYFISNGISSIGGYDIFRSKLQADGKWGEAENLGYPLNTTGDENFYFRYGAETGAYFSSARKGGKGLYDIYALNSPKEPEIADVAKETSKEIAKTSETSTIKIIDDKPAEKSTEESLTEVVKAISNKVDKPVEKPIEKPIEKPAPVEKIAEKTPEKKSEKPIEQPIEMIKVSIQKVYFRYDNGFVNEEYMPYLKELMRQLEKVKNKRELKIDIYGHADNKGNDDYNMKLSEARAKTVFNFLKKAGVPADVMRVIPMGETSPIAPNTNPDGSDNASGRAKNRRVEIKLINIPKELQATYEENEPIIVR